MLMMHFRSYIRPPNQRGEHRVDVKNHGVIISVFFQARPRISLLEAISREFQIPFVNR